MELSVWAEHHARQLLSPLERRWKHARAVGTAGREVGRHLTAEDAEVLLAAAYLHDIGYAPDLVETGFHQLDGASARGDRQTRKWSADWYAKWPSIDLPGGSTGRLARP